MLNRLLYVNKFTSKNLNVKKQIQLIGGCKFSTSSSSSSNENNNNNNDESLSTTKSTTTTTKDTIIINKTVAGINVTTTSNKSPHVEKNKKTIEREIYKKILLLSPEVIKSLENENWKLFKENDKKSMLADLKIYLSDPKIIIPERIYGLFISHCLNNDQIENAKFFFNRLPEDSVYFYPFNSILLHYVSKNELRALVKFFEANIERFKLYCNSNRFMVFLKRCLKDAELANGNEVGLKLFEKLLSILGEKDLLSDKVYQHAIGALVHSNRINDAIALYENEYLKFSNGKTDASIYFFLIQSQIYCKNLDACKVLFSNMIEKDQLQPTPAIYYHLIKLSHDMNDQEYCKYLIYDLNRRGNGQVAAMVILYASFYEDTPIYDLLTKIVDDAICGRDVEVKLDSDRVAMVRTVDTLITMFLKINRYSLALEWYSKRIVDYRFVPNFKNIGNFIVNHIEKREDAMRDFWIDILERFGAYVKEDFIKQILVEYNALDPLQQLHIMKNYLKVGTGDEELLYSTTDQKNIVYRELSDPSLKRLIHESGTRGLGEVLVNYINKMYLSKNKIPPGTLLIEAIMAIKATGDARLYMYKFYLPSNQYFRAIIFDPFIYTILLNPNNPRSVLNFGLDLIYREPEAIQNLVSISGCIFNVFLKDGNMEVANKLLNKMISYNKKFYIDDIPSNRENYLKCTLNEENVNKIASLIKSEQKVQLFISNLFLNQLKLNFISSGSPMDGQLLFKYIHMIKDIDIDTIKIYIEYLIKDSELNISKKQQHKNNNNINQDLENIEKQVINNLFRYDSKIIKNLLKSKQQDLSNRLKKLKLNESLDNNSGSNSNGNGQLVTIHVGESLIPTQFTLPKSKDIVDSSTILTLDAIKNLNEIDILIQSLLSNDQYIKSVLNFILNENKVTNSTTTTTNSNKNYTSNSYLNDISQKTLELILKKAYQIGEVDMISPIFEKYHKENGKPQIYTFEIIETVLKTTNYDKDLLNSIKKQKLPSSKSSSSFNNNNSSINSNSSTVNTIKTISDDSIEEPLLLPPNKIMI